MDELTQKQKGGDNSVNVQAGRDATFIHIAKSDERDFGIIDEIFKSVIKSLGSSESLPDKEHINLSIFLIWKIQQRKKA